MKNWLSNIVLEGVGVRLAPLQIEHRTGLLEAASDGKLWELWFTSVPSEDTIDDYIGIALEEKKVGRSFPFTIFDNNTNKILGSTRYLNAEPAHRRLEIGATWYAMSYHRTAVNSECKYLLLSYAFENLACIAVEFRTDWFNRKSRAAIERLGAKQDGILRNHRINPDGSFRDTVVFSITDREWTGVKKSLLKALKQQ
ncbi:MAG: N-acetyltransferase [Cyclobacteriaceae bacterium]|nr:MAG: N-acetyltransferase [Cyclobacteriaceae bacterium]